MRIIAVSTLKAFWEKVREAEAPLRTWVAVVRAAQWPDPPSVKRDFGSADILKGGRVVCDIGGNKYRLVAWINYPYATLYVRFIGTHKDYDKIDANEV
jgi:mRNA interferase HigB